MATCKDCLHVGVCGWSYLPPTAEQCVDFKDKAKYVVREKGEWTEHQHTSYDDMREEDVIWFTYACSVCGGEVMSDYDFCPNCGADMRKGENG